MSLMLPHLIDDLSGKTRDSTLIKVPGSETEVATFLDLARQAEKFQFGEMPMEQNPDPATFIDGRPTWVSPIITKVEHEAWEQGLIPLPAPVCWYEYLLGGEPTGMLVIQPSALEGHLVAPGLSPDSDGVIVQRVDYNRARRGGVFTGAWVAREYDRSAGPLDFHLKKGKGAVEYWTNERIRYVATGPAKVLDFITRMHARGGRVLELASDYYMTMYLTLMLSSLTTEVRVERPPEKLNRARMKRGHEPLPPHRIVTIVPDKYVDRSPDQGGHHRPPRLHWRRSHKRHYPRRTPGSVWAEHEVHRGITGWWVGLIARQLVGRKELGEVTHEYFVRDREKETA